MRFRGFSRMLAGIGVPGAFLLSAMACDMASVLLVVDDGGPGDVDLVRGDRGEPAGDSGGGGGGDTGVHPDAGGCDCPDGCCNELGDCTPGTGHQFCGKAGGACKDCVAAGGACVDQACVVTKCKVSSDCDLGLICFDGTCVPGCNKDADCPGATSKCKTAAKPHGACVACLADGDCAGLGSNYTCTDNACEKGLPICSPKCLAWEECGEDQQCHVKPGMCASDADCGPDLCDINTHQCKPPECTVDGDCGDPAVCPIGCGGVCSANKCQCISVCGAPACGTCTDTADCQPGLTCSGLGTKKCYQMGCASDADCVNGKKCYGFGSYKFCSCI